jgi:hypothetical protein
MRAKSIATGSQIGQGLWVRQTDAIRSVPGMNLESTQRASAHPQDDSDRHSLRRLSIGKNQRSRRPITRARWNREIDAGAATPATANDLDFFELTEIAPRTGSRRAEERLDKLLLPLIKGARKHGLLMYNQPQLHAVAITLPAAKPRRRASESRRRHRQQIPTLYYVRIGTEFSSIWADPSSGSPSSSHGFVEFMG